jgi:hypothetical protein
MAKRWEEVLGECDDGTTPNMIAWGVPVAMVQDMGTKRLECLPYQEMDNLGQLTKATRAVYLQLIKELKVIMRDLHYEFYRPSFPKENLARLGLSLHDTTYTLHSDPTSQPDTEVLGTTNRYEHLVRALNRITGDTSKPPDASGVRYAWQVGGEKPTSGERLPKSKSQRKSSYVVVHTEEDKGKTAYYATCYTNDKNGEGKWSSVVEAVIA